MNKLLVALTLFSSAVSHAADVEYGKYIYEYQADTYRVQMLRYGAADQNQFLIKVSGIDNDQDGKIY